MLPDIFNSDKQYIAGTYARFPLNLVSGKGSLVYDEKGKEYIDLATGIAVNTFGFCDSEWTDAVTRQLSTLQHASNLYYTSPCVELAKELCTRTGMSKVFFGNSGAEANECAIKAARKYAFENKGPDCYKIITLKNSFHGRTITTLAATGQDVFHTKFLPLTEGFIYVEANNVSALYEAASSPDVAAIMFEVVQGEGGVNPMSVDFAKALTDISEKNDILLIADEVQTGNGRTGELYGYMNYSLKPHIVSTAKGLGGGLPIGATLLCEKLASVFEYGDHGSTFGANPVCCAGALNIISRIDSSLLEGVRKKSELIRSTLKNTEGIKSVSGLGLMLGIECDADASSVVSRCMEQGVLVIKAKHKVRLLPALNIPDDLLIKALEVIKNACKS